LERYNYNFYERHREGNKGEPKIPLSRTIRKETLRHLQSHQLVRNKDKVLRSEKVDRRKKNRGAGVAVWKKRASD